MKKMALMLVFFSVMHTVVFFQPVASADPSAVEVSETSPSCGVCQLAESERFSRSAFGKIERGVVNILLGWTNLIAKPIQKSGGSVWTGIGDGFVYTFNRTVQGVVELGLFWLPPSHGEPLKECALGDLRITGR